MWSVVAGGCSGMFTGVLFAETSSRVAEGQQGRALGWVMSGQSLTLLLGVPLAAFLGSIIGWRGVNLCVGVEPSGKRGPVSSVRTGPPEWCPSSSLSPAHSTTVSFPVSFLLAAAATRSDLVAATTETHLEYPRSLCTSGLLLTAGLGRILPIVACSVPPGAP